MAVPALARVLVVPAVAGVVIVPVPLLVGAGSLVVRFRRARGTERQQLRWLAYAAALAAGLLLVALVAGFLLAKDEVVFASLALGMALLPLATSAAILRYRLYDLDRIISRTLAYGLLTVLLGGGYAGVVLGLGQHADLDDLTAELLAVAQRTVEPTMVSLWLRPRPGAWRILHRLLFDREAGRRPAQPQRHERTEARSGVAT